ncbi:MAG: hypothetical protein QGH94_18945, partial [Phycisphaerae bacterium]|nr:hypothetical protein [Phycisphaerae bacterium]
MNKKSMIVTSMLLLVIGSGVCSASVSRRGPSGTMRWIWYPEGKSVRTAPGGTRYFRTTINIPAGVKIKRAQFRLTVDDSGIAYLNGKKVGNAGAGWQRVNSIDLSKRLKPGRNVLAVAGTNARAGAAGFIGRLKIQLVKGKAITVVTNGKWRAGKQAPAGWTSLKFDDSAWPKAVEIGPLNTSPWSGKVNLDGTGMIVDVDRELKPVTAEQAVKMIETDWMHQAGGAVSPERCGKEIGWTRKLAKRITAADGKLTFQAELSELGKLEARIETVKDDEDTQKLYFAIRRIKRKITLANPLVNFDKIL